MREKEKGMILRGLARIAIAAVFLIIMSRDGMGNAYVTLNNTVTQTANWSTNVSNPYSAYFYDQNTGYTDSASDSFIGNFSFLGGYTIGNSHTSTFEISGVIDGNLAFGNGASTLLLNSDLHCNSNFTISTGVGGGTLSTPSSQEATLCLSNDLSMPGHTMTVSGNSLFTIDGKGSTVTIPSGGSFAIGNSATLTLRNMNLVLGNSSPFSFGTSSSLVFENVNIFLAASATLSSGTYTFKGVSSINGLNGEITFDGLTIGDTSMLSVSKGVTIALSSGTITMGGANSILMLDGCSFDVTAAGATILGGMILFDNKVLITTSTHTLQLGNGSGANNVETKVLSGAYVIVEGSFNFQSA